MRETGQDEPVSPAVLLGWYDRAARRLPWRVMPAGRAAGRRPDPYRVWLSEVMLQQTTVAAVLPYFHAFTGRWPDVGALAAAPDDAVMAAWAGLGYYARARNLIACARAVAAAGGAFPDTEDALRALPGVGAYTAAAIAAIVFDRRAVVVDGNVERVMARVFAVETPLPAAKPALRAHAARLTPPDRAGDYAQAVMDLGATICTPRRPACGLCPWSGGCLAHAAGLAADLPRRQAKAAKPTRRGVAWCAVRGDAVLLERRPATGLLGGTLGLPGCDWRGDAAPAPPFPAAWRAAGLVRHVFTHFQLELEVRAARIASEPPPGIGAFHPAAEAARALPIVMRKALRLGLAAVESAESMMVSPEGFEPSTY
jgi:A/G-specific adenine glycosylase